MKETVVRIIRKDILENELSIDFKIIEYREFDGKLDLEPIATKYMGLGINWIAYPLSVIFMED